MAAFEYVALNERGREEKGVLEADGMRQVRQLLRDRGLAPLSVSTAVEAKESTTNLRSWFRPSLGVKDRALITRQMATLIAAALPVEEALLAVSQQTEKRALQSMLLAIRSKVMEGFSLTDSLADYPRAFPNLYRATIAAGEATGHLDLILNRLADFTESQHLARQKIQQAMVYPIILFVLTIVILAGLLGYVVPDIVKVFRDSEQELPRLTSGLIAVSDFLQDNGLVIFILVVVTVVAIRQLLTIESIRRSYDRRLLHVPLVAKMSRGFNTAQFASTLSILNSSGVPLVDAMRISGQVLSNSWLREKVTEATVKVSEGTSLKVALEQSGYFPPMMLHMIASGEASGELDDMLTRTADHMQQDVEALTGILLSLFGPMMLLIMGGAVFIIVMAILLPIMNLNQLVM
ncbi:MAG: type II secretion system inner membrane protein GspF [Pseudomonadales bacterium]|nr:type II secretion system inner membrane protein GspF [Pseudomonadales bacterium]MDP7359839.1 type II secretion system inner membrane protein GspF [Pseudomonadales bacterium]MDP7595707.1 type II secretion system inner membrane protein GspF [Pseudomonadales bacterium]HJN49179.1 type II secretion system inner membrane protein GspF [Pseudomonadales bacterium]